MTGWIKIYRDLQDHWLAQDMEKLGRWTSLLLMATHEDKKVLVGNQLIEIKRGQLIASNSFLAERWKISERSVLRFLDLLESDSMLHRCTHRKVTILTICNYDSYQEKRKSKVTNTCTDEAPIAHRKVTELKNIEEDKEINNTNSARTHEGKFISWDAAREREFYNSFKGRSAYLPMATAVGKSGKDVVALLDVYMATREVINRGHKDYNEFVSLFKWHIENNKIKLHEQPQQKKSKNILEMYG